MKKLYILLFLFALTSLTFAQTSDLYFSMYGEGSSNNKFLEIYNGTGGTVNLDNYAFPNVGNAPAIPGEYEFWNTFPSGFMLADGDVFVIAHGSSNATILAAADMTFNFLSNGDDGFALVANDGVWNDANTNSIVDAGEMTGFTVLDWLGNWDGDPGTAWAVAGDPSGTQDHTLTRKASVCGPNNDWAASAGTDADNSEWVVGAIDSGWGSLGTYTGCSSSPELAITSPSEGQEFPWGTTDVTLSVAVQNFAVANGTGDGHIHWTLNAAPQPMKYDTADENISVTDGGSYTVDMALVDNSHVPIVPAVIATVNFTVADTPPALPIYDGFDYGIGQNLGDQSDWSTVNSGDAMLINSGNLSYPGLATSSGQSVSYDGSGTETNIEFFPVTSGSVYASFIFEVTDQSAITDLTDGGYFAAIADSPSGYDARMWVRPNPDAASSTFDIGFGYVSSIPDFTTPAGSFNVGDDIFVVMSYDLDTSTVSAWINPSSVDFEGSAPAATITAIDTAPPDPASLGRFILRQDSTGETPFMVVDELRLGTSWAEVTPTTLSVNSFDITNVAIYPNPNNTGELNINTSDNGIIDVKIFDILGKQVIDAVVNNNRLDVSNLNTGLYIVKLTQGNATVSKKLVIE